MGILTLVLLIALELFFLVWSLTSKNNHRAEKSIVSICLLLLFGLLLTTGIYQWSFRYGIFLLVLVLQAISSVTLLVRKKTKIYSIKKSILRFVMSTLILSFALFPAILFPQYQQPPSTGTASVATAKYTWVNESRLDEFSASGENRALTVEFWYPENANETYPLVVFSHGAFGFSGSNYSTFAELASNGYVVASIGHTHQAFYTLDTTGKLTIANSTFINRAAEINDSEDTRNDRDIYETTSQWMELRTADEHFVIDKILAKCAAAQKDSPFALINPDKIGLMGHSLGGASSAQVGRERTDIDAVIVLDGTMLGEEIAFKNNIVVLNKKPYPVPLLNVYAEDHYTNAKKFVGENYANFYATENAVTAYHTVLQNAGHLNFTDLPIFSPTLAKMLGVGTINPRYGIETMNKLVLEFFNAYLKDAGTPKIAKEY